MIRRVALAGPMGSGKSTVGRILSTRWAVEFRDLDASIGDAATIFEREGEVGFRAREREALACVVAGQGVLALGGGTVVDPGNRRLLREWTVIVLTGTHATLLARIGGDPRRPLVGQLESLLAARASAYALAGPAVATDGRTVDEVADAVEALCPW